jgi:hypothetical protein
MARRDTYLDAMLRELGAANYASLHGRAGKADVTRALGSVAGHIGDKPIEHPAAALSARHGRPLSGGWNWWLPGPARRLLHIPARPSRTSRRHGPVRSAPPVLAALRRAQ